MDFLGPLLPICEEPLSDSEDDNMISPPPMLKSPVRARPTIVMNDNPNHTILRSLLNAPPKSFTNGQRGPLESLEAPTTSTVVDPPGIKDRLSRPNPSLKRKKLEETKDGRKGFNPFLNKAVRNFRKIIDDRRGKTNDIIIMYRETGNDKYREL